MSPDISQISRYAGPIIIAAIILTLMIDIILPGVQERTENGEKWCIEKYGADYTGLANVQSIKNGGLYCILTNDSTVKVPTNTNTTEASE
jgi:hypothetical protein